VKRRPVFSPRGVGACSSECRSCLVCYFGITVKGERQIVPLVLLLLLLSLSSSSLLSITCMHGIYNYVPATSHVCTVYSVAAVLYLQFALHVMLFRPYNTFCTFTSALPAAVCSAQYGCCLQYLNFVLSRCVAQVLSEVILKWFQSPLLLPVSLLLSHSTF